MLDTVFLASVASLASITRAPPRLPRLAAFDEDRGVAEAVGDLVEVDPGLLQRALELVRRDLRRGSPARRSCRSPRRRSSPSSPTPIAASALAGIEPSSAPRRSVGTESSAAPPSSLATSISTLSEPGTRLSQRRGVFDVDAAGFEELSASARVDFAAAGFDQAADVDVDVGEAALRARTEAMLVYVVDLGERFALGGVDGRLRRPPCLRRRRRSRRRCRPPSSSSESSL